MTENESIDVALQQPASKWSIYKTYLRYGMIGNWIALSVFLLVIPFMFYSWWESAFLATSVVPFSTYLLVLVASFCIPLLIWSDLPPSKRSYLLLSLDGRSSLWLKVGAGLLMHLFVVVIFSSMILVTTWFFPEKLTVGGTSGFIALLLLTLVVSCTVYIFQNAFLILTEHPVRWWLGTFVLYIVLIRTLGAFGMELPFDAVHNIRTIITYVFEIIFYPMNYIGNPMSDGDLSSRLNEFPRQLVISSMWLVISLILLVGTISYRSKER